MSDINIEKTKKEITCGGNPVIWVIVVFSIIIIGLLLNIAFQWVNISEPAALIGALALLLSAIIASIPLISLNTKIRLDIQLKESAKAEMDVNLVKLFTELMDIAEGRRKYYISEKAAEFIVQQFSNREKFDESLNAKNDKEEEQEKKYSEKLNKLHNQIKTGAIIAQPEGLGSQNAAMYAMSILGDEHEILKDVALKAFEYLKTIEGKKEIAESYIQKLKD